MSCDVLQFFKFVANWELNWSLDSFKHSKVKVSFKETLPPRLWPWQEVLQMLDFGVLKLLGFGLLMCFGYFEQ